MKRISMTIGMFIFLVAVFNGCGKSADDLYSEGKALILKKETVEQGLKILEKFERKYPEDPRTPEIILACAMTLSGEKRFDEAVETYNRLTEKYPESAEAYKGMFLLGYMYYEDIKDNDKTVETFKKFIKTYPDSELVPSAEILIENIGLPVEEWSTVKKIGAAGSASETTETGK